MNNSFEEDVKKILNESETNNNYIITDEIGIEKEGNIKNKNSKNISENKKENKKDKNIIKSFYNLKYIIIYIEKYNQILIKQKVRIFKKLQKTI